VKKLLALTGFASTLALASVGAGCGSNAEPSGSTSAVSDTTQGLSLTEASPGHVAGSFVRGGVRLSFDATATATGTQTFLLKGQGGHVLLSATSTADGRQMELMDGALRYKASASAAGGTVPPGSGDTSALAAFINSPEAPILPWLSRELGLSGITGVDYPASFMLHSFGVTMARAHAITLPPLPPSVSTNASAKDYYSDNGAYCDGYSNEWGSDCLGMCGPGCSCWQWVCGDCCVHYGCLNHDEACRDCAWDDPGACLGCSSFSAFFSGGGCSHP
jgi:hypothetical protein